MVERVLVAYASEFGTTAEVAELIGATLRDGGTTVDVSVVFDAHNVHSYDAAIIGSPIYNGAWLPEAVDFVRDHAAALAGMPVAYFAVSMSMRQDTPANRQTVLAYLRPVLAAAPDVRPIDIGLFAGHMRYRNLPFLERLIFLLRARLPSGDFRDREAIRAWVLRLRAAFAESTHGGTAPTLGGSAHFAG